MAAPREEAAVDALLTLFAAKVAERAEVLETDLRRGLVVVREGAGATSAVHRLHLDREVLARELAGDDPSFWGPGVDRVESTARFLVVHLDESLATRPSHPSGWWTHAPGAFEPRPPWVRGPHAQG